MFRRRPRGDVPDGFNLDPSFPFVHAIDVPRLAEVAVHSMPLRGWIAVPPMGRVEGPWVEHGARVPLALEPRVDVERMFPESKVIAFRDLVPVDEYAASREWKLGLRIDDVEYQVPIENVHVSQDAWEQFEAAKSQKLSRIQEILRCPGRLPSPDGAGWRRCGGRLVPHEVTANVCTRCEREFTRGERSFNFLDPGFKSVAFSTPDNQDHTYYGDDRTLAFINEVTNAGGLVLDNGSGFKRDYLDCVVNFDIVDYATTDVLGSGETLPFADESFDAVLSFSVLEHVRDPFQCASEIARVLKPDGCVHISVPHLAPYHGFPSHYYNMTRQGLEALFADGFSIELLDTPDWGHPIHAITWILRLYAEGLEPERRQEFESLRVDELVGFGGEYADRPFVTELDPDSRRTLACNNYLIAKKTHSNVEP